MHLIFCPFLIGLLVFLLVSCKYYLYILDTKDPDKIYDLKMFSANFWVV